MNAAIARIAATATRGNEDWRLRAAPLLPICDALALPELLGLVLDPEVEVGRVPDDVEVAELSDSELEGPDEVPDANPVWIGVSTMAMG